MRAWATACKASCTTRRRCSLYRDLTAAALTWWFIYDQIFTMMLSANICLHIVEHSDHPWCWHGPVCTWWRCIPHCHCYAWRCKHWHDTVLMKNNQSIDYNTHQWLTLSYSRTTHNSILIAYPNVVCNELWHTVVFDLYVPPESQFRSAKHYKVLLKRKQKHHYFKKSKKLNICLCLGLFLYLNIRIDIIFIMQRTELCLTLIWLTEASLN